MTYLLKSKYSVFTIRWCSTNDDKREDDFYENKPSNAIILTVPIKFGIDENIDYLAVKGPNDSITFIKKKATIFEEAFAQKETIDAEPGFPEDVLLERK